MVPYNSCTLQVVLSVLWRHFWSNITAVTYQLYHLFYGDNFCLTEQLYLTRCIICFMGTLFVPYNSCNLPVVSSVVWRHLWSHITAVTYKLYHQLYGDFFCLIQQLYLTSFIICCMGTFFVSYNSCNLHVVSSVLWRHVWSQITAVTNQLYYLFYGDGFCLIKQL